MSRTRFDGDSANPAWLLIRVGSYGCVAQLRSMLVTHGNRLASQRAYRLAGVLPHGLLEFARSNSVAPWRRRDLPARRRTVTRPNRVALRPGRRLTVRPCSSSRISALVHLLAVAPGNLVRRLELRGARVQLSGLRRNTRELRLEPPQDRLIDLVVHQATFAVLTTSRSFASSAL
jgi:hypothetical protein